MRSKLQVTLNSMSPYQAATAGEIGKERRNRRKR